MEKLIVGDKLCYIQYSRYGSGIVEYRFATVVRLTATRAVLSNGVMLINEPKEDYRDGYGYPVYGDTWSLWKFQTSEIIDKANKFNEKVKKLNWFNKQKFSDKQKELIYDNCFELIETQDSNGKTN